MNSIRRCCVLLKKLLLLVVVSSLLIPSVLAAQAMKKNCDAEWSGFVYDKNTGSCVEKSVTACSDPFMFHSQSECQSAVQKEIKKMAEKTKFGSLTESDCRELMKEKYPTISEDRLDNACEGIENNPDRQINLQAQLTGTKRDFVLEKISEKIGFKQSSFSNKLKGFSGADLSKINGLGRAEIKSLMNKDPETIAQMIKNKKIISLGTEDWFKNKILSESELKNFHNQIEQKMSSFKNNLNLLANDQNAFKKMVSSGVNEEQIISHVKEMLLRGADLQVQRLEEFKLRIQAEEGLSEEETTVLVNAIDDSIRTINEYKEKISKANTKEELKSLLKELKELWADKKSELEFYKHILVKAKVEQALKKSQELEAKFDQKISELMSLGANVGASNEQLNEFSQYVESAKEKLSQAREKGYSYLNSGDEDYLKEAKSLVKSAKDDLKKARDLAREITSDLEEISSIVIPGGNGQGINFSNVTGNFTVDQELPELPGLPPNPPVITDCEEKEWKGYVFNALTKECEELVSKACENPFDYTTLEDCLSNNPAGGSDNLNLSINNTATTNHTNLTNIPLPPSPPAFN